jgi:hypothetical protein
MRRGCGYALALTCAAAFFCAASAHASERVIADFDGDGVRDQVVVSRHDPTIMRVWLSSTRRVDIIRSREPILQIAAANLDDDARAELIARVPATLRVWAGRNGHFHTYRPRLGTITTRLSRARNHASNADPLCAEIGVWECSVIAPSLQSTLLTTPPPPRAAWTDASNPVRGPTSRTPVHPFSPRPPPAAL